MDGDQVRVKKTESRTKWRDCGVALETFPRLIFGVRIFFFKVALPSPLVSRLQSTSPRLCPCPPSHSDRPSFSVPLAVPLAFSVPLAFAIPLALALVPGPSNLRSGTLNHPSWIW